MSETSIARTARCVHHDTTFVLPSPIIECGNLSVFLDLLSPSSTVLLMPLCRRESLGDIEMTLAVQVTAQITDAGGPVILTATLLAAACTILGAAGSLLIPCEERGKPAAYVQQRARDLQNELLECLMACLAEHPSVAVVHHPARYGVPREWVWRLSRLDGSGITFIKGHWSRPVLPVAAADPYGHVLA